MRLNFNASRFHHLIGIDDPWSKVQLGMHLLNENRITEALDLLRTAAGEGQSVAQLYLAETYREGEPVPKDMVTR